MSDLKFTGERIVPQADNCEPTFADKMYQEHAARYLFAAQLVAGRSVLDIGCGVGYGSQLLAQRGAASVVAFDLSPEAIAHARVHYAHPNLRYEVASAETFDFDRRFDVITCFELIEHVSDYRVVFDRIAAAIAPDGFVVMSTPRALAAKRSEFHTKEFTLEEFRQLFARYFGASHFYFENNHLASLIAGGEPRALSINPLKPQFRVEDADYFVVVASPSAAARVDGLEPLLVLNDDRYVLLLERDVGILRRAENDQRARADALEAQVRALAEQVDAEKHRVAEEEALLADVKARLAAEEAELREAKAESEASQAQLEESAVELEESSVQLQASNTLLHRLSVRLEESKAELANANAALEKAQAELARSGAQLEAARGELEAARAARQHLDAQLQELEARRREAERDAARVRTELVVARANLGAAEERNQRLEADCISMRAQLDGARADVERAAQRIASIHASRSWRVTAPLRAVGSAARRSRDLVRRVHRYRRAHGALALLEAMARKARDRLARRAGPPGTPLPIVQPPMTPALSACTESATSTNAAQRAAQVILFIGCWEGESKRYRVYNVAAALESRGIRTRVEPFANLACVVEQRLRPNAVVLFRAPYEELFAVAPFLEYARRNRIRTIFDVDDLVFNPDVVPHVDAFRYLSPAEQVQYMDGVHKYRRMLLECDVATVTTPYLADEVRKLGKPCHIVPNSLNAEQLAVADALLSRPRDERPYVRIGYFSGTRTHQKDFAQAEPALLRLFDEFPNVRLLVAGYLDLGDAWKRFADRIDVRGFEPYQDMLRTLASCDINIAPLEMGNPFCESKSELKFFEAAVVEVPTVASATRAYRDAIDDGVTGFLAADDETWYRALHVLVENGELREQVGRAARAAAVARFGPEVVAREALDAYGLAKPAAVRRTDGAQRLRIDWIVPGMLIGGGGHRNIFRAAHHLQEFGHDVGLHFANVDDTAAELRAKLHRHFYPFQGRVRVYDGTFEPVDVVFATHWSTVSAALGAKDVAREVMYFVQDFEPSFVPMGSEYVLAENTYRLGLYCVTSGPWCERILRNQYGAEADHFRFPIDRGIYFPRARTSTRPRIVFFAKPEMPRRCFELGALALRRVHALRPDVEIVLFGSSHLAKQSVDFPVTLLKLVPTIEELAELYSNADIGIAFSTTNPSLVPYEMMACGLPIVDLDRPGNEVNYGDRRDIALLVDPIPERMAEQVVALLDDPAERERRARRGLEFTDTFPTEEQMARRIEQLIVNRLQATASRAQAAEAGLVR